MVDDNGFDVLIVGGGLTGCALALALAGWPGRVGLVESQLPAADAAASFDERHLALSLASIEALQGLGVWSRIVESTQSIKGIHVSSAGEFGSLRLSAADHGLEYFGRVCPARALGAALNAAVAALPGLTLLRPARLLALTEADRLQVELQTGAGQVTHQTRLLVGADGSDSTVRKLAGGSALHHDYGQTAIVSNLETERPHAGVAFERLTRDGPLALLPLPGKRSGLVWTQRSADAQRRLALSDREFLDELQPALGWRLGRIGRIGRRQAWPLALMRAEPGLAGRCVLIGNAAQTIHPIGAQGFNLGLRDALALAQSVRTAADPGAAAVLAGFNQARSADRGRTIGFSDGLVQASASTLLPMRLMRTAGLLALDALRPLQAALVQFGTGYGRA